MDYFLSQPQVALLPSNAYWLNSDGVTITSLTHLDTLKNLGLTINSSVYDVVSTWTTDFAYKIYNYLDEKVENTHLLPKHIFFPEQLNCNLFKDYVLYYGDRILTIYYQDYDPVSEVLLNPLIKIAYVYHRDTNHYIKSIGRTFYWMLQNGSWSTDTYTDIQPFTHASQKAKELGMVRSNILEEAQGLAKLLGLTAQMLQIYTTFAAEVSLYEKVGSTALSTAVATAGARFEWLNNMTPDKAMTLRVFLSYFFSIGTILA